MLRKRAGPEQCSPADVVEGFYLAHVLTALEHAGMLESLKNWTTVVQLARKHDVDRKMLEAALQFVAAHTGLLAHRAGKYRLTKRYDFHARFMLFQYLGTYRRHAIKFGKILRHPLESRNLIDRKQYAKAFAGQGILADNIVADLVLQLGLNHVLDLGCGAGTLLLNLASRNHDFAGWGLDSNTWMCSAARKRIASLGLGRRIGIFRGDCRDLKRALPASVVNNVSVIIAASVINEFFAEGITKAVEFLTDIRATLPGRTMIIADYYGYWNSAAKSKEMALHNFIQVISGQGVPPADLSGWKKIYQGAGCHFIHAVQLQSSPYFIHILKL